MLGNEYSYSNGLRDVCCGRCRGCGCIPNDGVFVKLPERGSCCGDTGVETEGTVSTGEVDEPMSIGKRLMSKVSGLAWKKDWA